MKDSSQLFIPQWVKAVRSPARQAQAQAQNQGQLAIPQGTGMQMDDDKVARKPGERGGEAAPANLPEGVRAEFRSIQRDEAVEACATATEVKRGSPGVGNLVKGTDVTRPPPGQHWDGS